MKQQICPFCGSINALPILYGDPTEEAMKAEEKGEIWLGGCIPKNSKDPFHCKTCGNDFDGKTKKELQF